MKTKSVVIGLMLSFFGVLQNDCAADSNSITLEKTGRSIATYQNGQDSSVDPCSYYPNGGLHIGYDCNATYSFFLPNVNITGIAVEIYGKSSSLFGLSLFDRSIRIADKSQEVQANEGWNHFSYAGSNLPAMTVVDGGIGKRLDITFIPDLSDYDVNCINVTYACSGISATYLTSFHQAYSGALAIRNYKSQAVNYLWDPCEYSAANVWGACMEAHSFAENLSDIDSSSLYTQVKAFDSSLQSLFNLYDYVFNYLLDIDNFQASYTLKNGINLKSEQPNHLDIASTQMLNLAKLWYNSMSDGTLSQTEETNLNSQITSTSTDLNNLQNDVNNVFATLYSIYQSRPPGGTPGSGYGDGMAETLMISLEPLMNYAYKSSSPYAVEPNSYLPNLINAISQQAGLVTGSLNVTIFPPTANNAGAQWQVDGGAWHKSGDPQNGLSIGLHTVNFNSVMGWLTPPGQTVQIDQNSTEYIYVYMQISPIGDFTGDGNVDFRDFIILAQNYLNACSAPDWCKGTDLDHSGDVDMLDFALFARHWLEGAIPDDMVYIAGGTFQMGDSKGDGHAEELPVHTVTLSSFYIDKYDITNQQYCSFLNSAAVKVVSGVVYASTDSGNSYSYCDTSSSNAYSQIAYDGGVFSVRTKGGRSMSNDPMVMASWYGAAAYCNWRSQQEGKGQCYNLSTWVCDFTQNGYHLPTEAQWEYSARGGLLGNRFPWGDTITHGQANYDSYSGYSYDLGGPPWGYDPTWSADGIMPFTSPVGSFAANGYGLYDMGANVWQWCNDWYISYSSSPQTNPTGPATGSDRVICGGGWAGGPGCGRVALRGGNYPYLWHYDTGFRVSLGLN